LSDSVLVIGGGIAGIQASLDLAHAGTRVVLVEREATIGGVMAVLDKNFPTLDCSICIEAPKMSEVDLHPNIEILSPAEAIRLEGEPGDFQVQVRQKARFVTDGCTRCGECTQVCPVVLPNEYDSGMAVRKAIYTPIPQAVPGKYLIDIDHCLNIPPNYLPCDRCSQACPPHAIDFFMPKEQLLTRHVGSIIVAVGYDSLDPHQLRQFGYGAHPDVLTALEFERLINSAGPTGGEIIRPSDGKHPHSILFVLCVGSRDQHHYRYCSRFCCMYSIKHAYQALDHGIENVSVLFMDLRAYGKGFDGFLQRTQEAGARFLRGRPSRIAPNGTGKLSVTYENTDQAVRIEEQYDMVVLANAVTPPDGLADLSSILGIKLDKDGFIHAEEIAGGLVVTSRPGIYAAGCASGPKDIPDSVAEGSGAAALAMSHLTRRHWPEPLQVEPMPNIEMPRVGVFVCHCGSNIAGVIDVKEVVEQAKAMPDVVYASDQMFSCAGNTQAEIEEAIRREGITRVVIAACSPKTHESIFRGVLMRAGLNPFLLEMSNIRNMDSWVHKFDHQGATEKAIDMVRMSVEKARLLTPLQITNIPLTQRVLVIGGGIAGMTAAAALAQQGIETHLIERQNSLGGMLKELDQIHPSGIQASDLVAAKAKEVEESGVYLHLGSSIETISGIVGNFHGRLTNGEEVEAGAIIMATGSIAHQPSEFNGTQVLPTVTNLQLEEMLGKGMIESKRITFLACVGSRAENMGCSRYCCTSMIGQALRLQQMGKKVRVLYKDIRTYSRHAEELYEEAMRSGVRFFRYDSMLTPQEAIACGEG
jgi:heterodisulfide reductase subunit A